MVRQIFYTQSTVHADFSKPAVGPLFLGPLSELYGRSIVLQLANLFFLGNYNIHLF